MNPSKCNQRIRKKFFNVDATEYYFQYSEELLQKYEFSPGKFEIEVSLMALFASSLVTTEDEYFSVSNWSLDRKMYSHLWLHFLSD